MTDWEIKPLSRVCQICQAPFGDRQPFVSKLVYGEEGYVRTDHCEACWNKQGKKDNAHSVWKGVFIPPPPKPEEPLKKETAEGLLRKLMKNEDDSHRNVIFILALMLERKRVLIERDRKTRDDGASVLVYEHRKTGETFVVPNPPLGMDQIKQVQVEVAAMLGSTEGAQTATTDDGPQDNQRQSD